MPRKLPPLVLVGRLFSLLFMANRSVISRCPEPCTKPLGISDGRIRDDQMSASSTYGDLFEIFGAHRARLNLTSWPPGYRANVDALGDFTWIKITLDQDMVITGIATQGYGNTSFSEWVSNYLIFYEKKGAEVTAPCANTDGEVMGMCNGNVDSTSIRYHNLATPVVTKSVLVNPLTWKDNIGLRMELYGCEPEFHFVAVITIQKTRFKLDYANSTTGSYLSMRDDVIAEVTDLLDEVSGFLFAKLRTLSPQAVHKKPVMAAEVQIYCIESRKAAVAQELNNSVQNGFSSILGEFLYLEELFNCECDVPSVKVELGKTLKNATIIYTNSRFLLKATYNGNCKDDNYGGYELHWEVSKCEESTGLCNQIIPYGKNKPGRPKYLFPRLFGASYMYIRCVLKNHSQQTITYDYGYARITLPPLVAVIEGLSSVLKGNESVVRLDGSASYDPEVKHKNSEGLSFTWYCRREGAGQDDKGTIWTVSPKEVRVCHGTEFRHLNNSLATLTLDLGKLSGNNAYVFELLVQKGDRSTRTIHKLQVEPPFKLFIGYQTRSGFLVINSGPKSYAIAQLPLGNITLEARVSDFMGASAIERFQVQVKPIPPKDIFKLVETSTSDGNSSLRGIINKENVDEAAQMAYSIVTAVEEANMAIEDKQRVKEAVLEQISVVEISSMQQVTQLSAVVVVTTEGEKDMRLTAQV
ncbi:uncharacterized protein LOC111339299 [Stylophora pistillata]|uniref:uncharacterized protein LOC111339299 n=1 Tax=Stylophora pistillata TaxID=50429 RepID=UPI000C04F577|nr:uncharacterized protein LOC111339299 [Stylophora pistillata]